jgi:DNA-binding CsgD family transcriptional regulator
MACTGEFRGAFDVAEAAACGTDNTCLRKWAPLSHFVLALTALRLGNLSTAIRYVKLLEEDSVFRRQTFPPGPAAWVIVQVTEAEAGPARALPLVAEMLAEPAVIRDLLVSEPAAVPWLVRFAAGQAEDRMASRAVALARQLAAENPGFRSVEAAALHCAGLYDDDIAQLRTAQEMHTDRWAQASAAEDAAILLARRTAHPIDTVGSLELVMHRYLELGALRDFARVKSRLREIGAKQNPRDSGRPRSGIPSLTDTEYSVAKLVAQGFTNAQAADQMFLSRHTVAFHLRKIFRKIGVESRVQLAREWNSLDTGE